MLKNDLTKISLNNVIVVFLFLTPHIFLSIIPAVYSSFYSVILYCLALIFFLVKSKYLNPIYKWEILFAICFIFFGFINLILKNSTAFFNIVSPLFGLFGYLYLRRNIKMNINIIKYVIVCFYIYFYFVYYSVIPDYFFRPGFDEDAIVFDNSSSNAISMTLVMLLFVYLILNKYYKSDQIKTIFYFSIITLVLVFIQQSRAALIIAFTLFFISFYEFDKKNAKRFLFLLTLTIPIFFVYYLEEILLIYDLFFSEFSLIKLSENVRSEAQTYFLSNLNSNNFFIGYPDNTIFASDTSTDMLYTYNVFLDVWNRYGFIPFIVLISVLLYRFYFYNRYFFPLYYFIPFLFYSFVESIFFPNYWDCFIYLLIFTPVQNEKSNVY